ncbi:hypothetical protein [Effusibacillus dendaii]|uniref:hypothetical protein n=1 Tax=Effusibacillus dendaii TaxID=2743772 RepID=UPI00190CF22F|nr:hypothetical protein [Effusibacillus dendaii]
MGNGINPVWWMALNGFLIFILLPGGFFMFRAFLRRMKREEEQENQLKNQE